MGSTGWGKCISESALSGGERKTKLDGDIVDETALGAGRTNNQWDVQWGEFVYSEL